MASHLGRNVEPSIALTAPAVRVADLLELTKPRITFMVVVSAAAGFYLGAGSNELLGDFFRLLNAMLGTALVASGASCLNQFLERESDRWMDRTSQRPLPAGRIEPAVALLFGVLLAVAGSTYLWFAANPLTAILGALTLLLYVAVYTPLKQHSSLCTIVGAVPGALPPVMGWTAATGAVTAEAWALFSILFFWQMPHFLAIAWIYRDDYRRGGQPMLPVIDPSGGSTARQIVLYGLALLPTSLLPAALGLCGSVYFAGALVLGLGFLAVGVHTAMARTVASARLLLRVSVAYLPALLALMALDKVPL
jgi:protoheme IX farnesyltransferase